MTNAQAVSHDRNFSLFLQDYHRAAAYGDCALAMLEESSESIHCVTKIRIYLGVVHHYSPLEVCVKGLLEAYHDGMAAGDAENAFLALFGKLH